MNPIFRGSFWCHLSLGALISSASLGCCTGAWSAQAAPVSCPEEMLSATVEVRFKTGTSQLLPSGKRTLDQVAACATAHPELRVTLTGYTNQLLGAEYALAIGQKNAEAALHYLLERAVPESQVTTLSIGRTVQPRNGLRVHFSKGS